MTTDEEDNPEGVYHCGTEKTSHKGFDLATLENLMKEWPVGSHIVMKSPPRVSGGKSLMYIG